VINEIFGVNLLYTFLYYDKSFENFKIYFVKSLLQPHKSRQFTESPRLLAWTECDIFGNKYPKLLGRNFRETSQIKFPCYCIFSVHGTDMQQHIEKLRDILLNELPGVEPVHLSL
jgi:hypothetical protein